MAHRWIPRGHSDARFQTRNLIERLRAFGAQDLFPPSPAIGTFICFLPSLHSLRVISGLVPVFALKSNDTLHKSKLETVT